jgi:hypothetical protein
LGPSWQELGQGDGRVPLGLGQVAQAKAEVGTVHGQTSREGMGSCFMMATPRARRAVVESGAGGDMARGAKPDEYG